MPKAVNLRNYRASMNVNYNVHTLLVIQNLHDGELKYNYNSTQKHPFIHGSIPGVAKEHCIPANTTYIFMRSKPHKFRDGKVLTRRTTLLYLNARKRSSRCFPLALPSHEEQSSLIFSRKKHLHNYLFCRHTVRIDRDCLYEVHLLHL